MKNVLLALTIILFASNIFAQDCQNDTIPPIVGCLPNVAADTCGFGEVTLSARRFTSINPRDNCTSTRDLRISFTIDPTDTIATFTSSSDSISIWVTDEAGNQSLCNSSLTIVDNSCQCEDDQIPPVAICKSMITMLPNEDGGLLLTPSLLNDGSFDNCSRVRLSLSPDLTDTMRIVFDTILQLFVTDEAGNQSSCFSTWQRNCDSDIEITGTVEVACRGNTGAIALDDLGGSHPPFFYRWSNGATGKNISELFPRGYTVTITDDLGCSYVETFIVPSSLELGITGTPACNQDGTATVAVQNGTAPYQYLWSTGEETESVDNLSEGNYSVIVSDAGGCIDTTSINIESTIEVNIAIDYDCDGKGNISITPQNNTGELFYTWENGDTGALLSALEAGTYQVTITDGNGCTRVCKMK